MASSKSLPRFARKEIRQFSEWLIDHGWIYEGDDNKGHAQFRYPSTGKTTSLPETPRHFPIQKNRIDALRLMGESPEGKRKSKTYIPPKAKPKEALTPEQLARTLKVIGDTCDGMIATSKRDGHPDAVCRVVEQVKRGVMDQVRKYA